LEGADLSEYLEYFFGQQEEEKEEEVMIAEVEEENEESRENESGSELDQEEIMKLKRKLDF